jgi:AcrR family transcriptional regulator
LTITAPLAFAPGADTDPKPEPEKRRQILDGATRVFFALGYEGASMSIIAHEAGVSKGTLYVYFTNKEALFYETVQEYCLRHTEHVFDSLDAETPLEAALLECGRRYMTYLTQGAVQSIYRLVIAESAKFPILARTFAESGPLRSLARVTEFLRARTAMGELRIDDCELAAMLFMALCKTRIFMPTLIMLRDAPTAAEINGVIPHVVKLFLNTYGVPQTARA